MGTPGFKLVVKGKIANAIEWRNVFYGTTNSDWGDAEIVAWFTELYSTIQTKVSGQVNVYGVDVAVRLTSYPDNSPEGWGASTQIPITWAGLDPGEMLPPADTMLVLASTGVKHVRGRKSIPGLTESNQGAGVLNAATISQLNAFGQHWAVPESPPTPGLDWVSCVWGPKHGYTPITNANGVSYVFHLDRRQYSRGV